MAGNLHDFYKGKKVFLTGHTGFKGSWLSLWLHRMGAEVSGFALEPEGSTSLFQIAEISGRVDSIIGDVRNFNHLYKTVSERKPDIIFHLAAQSLVRRSYRDPVGTFETNVMGTVNLFESVRQSGFTRAIVNITSDKCYRNNEWLWPYRESDHLGGRDPYSSSKACSELVTSSFRDSFFEGGDVKLASARAGNIIGGGDFSEDRIIPDIVRALAEGRKVKLRNPESVRPWQHILDALHGYLLLGQALSGENGNCFANAYNFSPVLAEFRPVISITREFIQRIGYGGYDVAPEGDAPHEARMLRLDPSRALSELQWKPVLGGGGEIEWTVDWYKQYLDDPSSAFQATMNQIESYNNLVK